jgi:obg-like ATPase 1
VSARAWQVVAFDDFKALQQTKGMGEVKAAGKYRQVLCPSACVLALRVTSSDVQEGKSYVVCDGDIIHFQFNVTAPAKKK